MTHPKSFPTPKPIWKGLVLGSLIAMVWAASLAAMSGNHPHKVEGDVVAPKATHKVSPSYPEEARKEGLMGQVIVQTVIDEQGAVTEIEVLQSVREDLDQAAVDAIRQWKFEPATLEGEPVAVYFNLTINFKLDGDKPEEASS